MGLLALFKKRDFILVTFCLLVGLKFLYSVCFLDEQIELKVIRVIALITFCTLSFLSINKKNKFTTLVMGVLITLSGIGTVLVAVLIPMSQKLSKFLFFLTGIYFTHGGFILIKTIKSVHWKS